MENDLTSARTYLNSIVSGSGKMNDFITIQNINLDRLPYGPFYQASEAEVNTVETIALKNHSYAGFAKALYYVLTGEVISSEIPAMLKTMAETRSNPKSISSEKTLDVYPNPFNNYLQIEGTAYDNLHLEVFNIIGEKVYSERLSDELNSKIYTDNWDQGVYLLRFISDGELIFNKKVILSR